MLNGKNILIYNWAGLGDTIMFTPFLRRLKQLYPHCRITFITKQANQAALSGLPYIDKVYVFKRKDLWNKITLIPVLAKQDYIVFTDWQPQLAFISKLLGVSHLNGKTRPGHLSEKLFERHIKTWVLDTTEYAADIISQQLSWVFNITVDANTDKLDVSLPNEQAVKQVDEYLNRNGMKSTTKYFCLAPFTGLEERNWPLGHAKKLTELVQEKLHIPVVLIGPAGKRDEAETIGGINLVGETSFYEMVELVRRSILFVGPDSGTMHVAGALRTSQIALFSNDLPSRWAPKNNCQVISLNLPCRNCRNEGIQDCQTRECNEGITPQMVFEAIKNKLCKSDND